MSILRVILSDQLSSDISALADLDPARDAVLMMEVAEAFRNDPRLAGNPRLAMPYRTLAGWSPDRRQAILQEADAFLLQIDAPTSTGEMARKPSRTSISYM